MILGHSPLREGIIGSGYDNAQSGRSLYDDKEMKTYFLWVILTCGNLLYEAVDLSAKKSLVWGPGLDARITLPARFFFVQSVDKRNNK